VASVTDWEFRESGLQVAGEGAQAAVGGGADGSGSFAQDAGGGLGV
jgi:hypothetical protein